MKSFLLLIILLLSAHISFGQTDTFYLNSERQYTDRRHAMSYRIAKKLNDGKFNISDYDLDGTLQMTVTNTSMDTPNNKYGDGLFTYYNSEGKVTSDGNMINGEREGLWTSFSIANGLTESQIYYKKGLAEGDAVYYDTVTQEVTMSGRFTNNEQSGKWIYRNKNGKISEEHVYSVVNGERVAATTIYDQDGRKYIEGFIINKHRNGPWRSFDPATGKISYELTYINDVLDGELKGYYPDGKLRRRETYVFGKMTAGTCYNKDGKEITYFPAGQDPVPSINISDYLSTSLKYPAEARARTIQGDVLLRFVIDEQGQPINIVVVQGIGGGCDEEAIRIIKLMPPWKPGTNEGKPVKTSYKLPVSFKLTN